MEPPQPTSTVRVTWEAPTPWQATDTADADAVLAAAVAEDALLVASAAAGPEKPDLVDDATGDWRTERAAAELTPSLLSEKKSSLSQLESQTWNPLSVVTTSIGDAPRAIHFRPVAGLAPSRTAFPPEVSLPPTELPGIMTTIDL
jgi:hypothetical protein